MPRHVTIRLRVTEAESHEIQRRANDECLSVSAYIRWKCLRRGQEAPDDDERER